MIGMMVNLSLHIRGLPKVDYELLKAVANFYFNIPPVVFKEVILSLASIEFVKLIHKAKQLNT